MRFERTRGNPTALAGRRLNHSATGARYCTPYGHGCTGAVHEIHVAKSGRACVINGEGAKDLTFSLNASFLSLG